MTVAMGLNDLDPGALHADSHDARYGLVLAREPCCIYGTEPCVLARISARLPDIVIDASG